MRELLFKALTSQQSNKRDFCVQEVVERNGVRAKTERRSLYFVTGKVPIEDCNDIEQVAKLKLSNLPCKKRHSYALRVHNIQRGEDKLMCKTMGSFYAVCENDIYRIAFMHSFKVTFENLTSSQKE
ncbi:MAG: hypothetical protein HQ547_01055 [Candidatus Omnitrophica bacterium]|nr:hypothetical protein [Candidatus Omnitrophota bacterium]